MHQQTRSSLVQIMAYHLISAKLLSDPILTHFSLDHGDKIQWIFLSKIKHFHSREMCLKCFQQNSGHSVLATMCQVLCWQNYPQRNSPLTVGELVTHSLSYSLNLLAHLLTDWLTNWLIDCLMDWLANSRLGSIKNREDCYKRWTPRNKYSLLFLICSVIMS